MRSIHQKIEDTNLDAGTNTLSSVAVTAGRIQKITDLAFSYTGTVTNDRIEIKAGGKTVYKTIANPTSGQIERIPNLGEVYLEAEEKIEMVVTDATATDDATLIIHGAEMPS